MEKKCFYRAPNGDKCAVGILIPDDDYDPEWESGPLEQVLYAIGLEEHHTLLHNLRDIHDDAVWYPNWRLGWISDMQVFAEDAGLDASVLNKSFA